MNDDEVLSTEDVRSVFELVNQVTELWADRPAWQDCLMQGIKSIIDGKVAVIQMMGASDPTARPSLISLNSIGWDTKKCKRTYVESLSFPPDIQTPGMDTLIEPLLKSGSCAYSRRMIVPDAVWHSSEFFRKYVEPTDCDEFVISMKAAPQLRSALMIGGNRAVGAEPVPLKAVRIMGLLAEEITPLIGTRLALHNQVGLEGLSPRLRETLDHLIRGKSEKEIAALMHIARCTVHEYIVKLHRHFDVSSRSELLSYFIARQPKPVPGTSTAPQEH